MNFQQILQQSQESNEQPQAIDQLNWPRQGKLLVAAPHPDDFDAIAVTLRFFQQQGYMIQLLVISGGSKGVEDQFLHSSDWQLKAQAREKEQRQSTAMFGLSDQQVSFLRLAEAADGELDDSAENLDLLRTAVLAQQADILFLPYGEDTNTAHQRNFQMIKQISADLSHPTLALYNKDAKTTRFSPQLCTGFSAAEAEWKAQLLRCHESQQARNLNIRGYGFDQRVLGFNRQCAEELGLQQEYAEVFQWEILA